MKKLSKSFDHCEHIWKWTENITINLIWILSSWQRFFFIHFLSLCLAQKLRIFNVKKAWMKCEKKRKTKRKKNWINVVRKKWRLLGKNCMFIQFEWATNGGNEHTHRNILSDRLSDWISFNYDSISVRTNICRPALVCDFSSSSHCKSHSWNGVLFYFVYFPVRSVNITVSKWHSKQIYFHYLIDNFQLLISLDGNVPNNKYVRIKSNQTQKEAII